MTHMPDAHFDAHVPTIRSVEELDGFRAEAPRHWAFTEWQIGELARRRAELLRDEISSGRAK